MRFQSRADGGVPRCQFRTMAHYLVVGLVGGLHLCGAPLCTAITPPDGNVTSPGPRLDAPGRLLSPQWVQWFTSGAVGCDAPWNRYLWRPAGLGSNLMYFMDQWLHGLARHGLIDVAVVVEPDQLHMVNCTGSNDEILHGYDCLFTPIPHICSFHSSKAWLSYIQERGIARGPEMEMSQTIRFGVISLPSSREALYQVLQRNGTDLFGAMAALLRILWDNLAPWMKQDARTRAVESGAESLGGARYLGLHIRRGDKILEHEMEMIATVDYLKAAMDYFVDQEGTNGTHAEDIKAIWVASDDTSVVDEVRALAPEFFPGVSREAILSLTSDVNGTEAVTHSNVMDYQTLVSIIADIQLLAGAEVFVGTYTSNIGRLVALLRESRGKAKDSSISLDEKVFEVYYEYEHVVRRRLHV